jgi:alpha-galactosidase
VFLFSQLAMPTYTLSGTARFDGLDPAKQYRLTVLDQPANLRTGGIMKKLPLWLEEETTLSGAWLAKAGIALPVMDPESAMLIKLEAV